MEDQAKRNQVHGRVLRQNGKGHGEVEITTCEVTEDHPMEAGG